MRTIRTIAFTILNPGLVAAFIPWLILRGKAADFDAGALRWLAGLPAVVGLVLLLASIVDFLVKGGGSPAIWFTRRLAWLIGEEPGRLVGNRFYRFSRNPMYLGVILIVGAEALWFGSYRLVGYSLVLIAFFNGIVRYVEEPHLQKKFGEEYEDYCRRVPRWF